MYTLLNSIISLVLISKQNFTAVNFCLLITTLLCLIDMMNEMNILNVTSFLGSNYLGLSLVILTMWLMVCIFMTSYKLPHKTVFYYNMVFMLLFLSMTFSTQNTMSFFIMFEATLIPTFFLIMGWGANPERINASMFMLFYTLAGAIPLLTMILLMYIKLGTDNFTMLSLIFKYNNNINHNNINILLMMGTLAFLMKLPMYLFHVWLPKAHVEAPVSGSMVLAGVLLKLGTYGLFMLVNTINFTLHKIKTLIIFGTIGGLFISVLCLRQTDMKKMVAYSSVVHMSFVMMGCMIFSKWSWNGSMEIMLGHGLCSSSLFFLVNVVYTQTNSRSMLINKGFMTTSLSITLWWFLLSICNMAAPPSMNLLGEVSLITSILWWEKTMWFFLFMTSFFSGAYTLYLYSLSQHGKSTNKFFLTGNKINEHLISLMHWTPLNLLMLKASFMMFVI